MSPGQPARTREKAGENVQTPSRGSQLRYDPRLLSNNITTHLGAMAYKIRQKPHFERELAKLLSSARRPWAAEVLPSGSPPGREKRPRPAWYRSGRRLGSNDLGPPKTRVRSRPCLPWLDLSERKGVGLCSDWLRPLRRHRCLDDHPLALGFRGRCNHRNGCRRGGWEEFFAQM